MGLFSNLFGNGGKDIDDAFNKMKNLADDLSSVKYADEDEKRIINRQNSASADNSGSGYSAEVKGPSGDSWGPVMPDEPNQFNSGLSYKDYFSNVYAEAFPAYQINKEEYSNRRGTVFTFSQDGVKKLVVEVASTSTYHCKLADECNRTGIPHLRFYYDYDGWWNTKSYVIRRTSAALGI